MIGRLLGVDFGGKRIGLALSEPGGIVSPLKVLEARPELAANAAAIRAVAAEYDVEGIVIGLPLNMDGTDGPQAKVSRRLAREIDKQIEATAERGQSEPGSHLSGEIPRAKSEARGRRPEVHLHDERLTSHAADQRLIGRDLTRKKKKARQDAVAAQILLQSFLEQQQ